MSHYIHCNYCGGVIKEIGEDDPLWYTVTIDSNERHTGSVTLDLHMECARETASVQVLWDRAWEEEE